MPLYPVNVEHSADDRPLFLAPGPHPNLFLGLGIVITAG